MDYVHRKRAEEIAGVGGQEAKKVRDYSAFAFRSFVPESC